jgi:hypothetical protein
MRRTWIGIVLSVTLHASLVAALTRYTLDAGQPVESPRGTIVWLASLVTPSDVSAGLTPDSEDTTSPAREPDETEPPAARTPTPERTGQHAAPDSAARRVLPAPPTAPESGARSQANGQAPLDRAIDLTEARQRAAKEVVEERKKAKSER